MSPEEKEMLVRSLALAEENNKILRSLKRSMVWARMVHIVYWVLIIGSAVGAYYFVQPYIDQVIGVYSGTKNSLNGVNSLLENLTN